MKLFSKVLSSIIIIYTLVGFFLVPYFVKTKGVELANEKINGKLTIEDISFNPYSFTLSLHGVSISSVDKKKLFSFNDFCISLKPFTLFDNTLHVSSLELQTPQLNVVYSKEKKLNLFTLLKPVKKEEKQPESKPMRFILDNLIIKNGTIKYEDYSKKEPYYLSLENFVFHVKNVDTKINSAKNADSVLRFDLSDGGKVEIINKMQSITPFKTDGVINLHSMALYTEWKYFQDMLNFEIADGKLDMHAKYHLDIDKLKEFTIDNSSLKIEKLRIKPKDGFGDILGINSMKIQKVDAHPLQNTARVGSFLISGVDLKASRDANNTIDWQEYLKVNKNTQAEKKQEQNETKKWQFKVDKFGIDDAKVSFTDRAVSPSQTTNLQHFVLHVNDIDLDEGKTLNYDFMTDLNEKTKIATKGKMQLQPFAQSGEVWVGNLDFKLLKPYLQKRIEPFAVDGDLSLHVKEKFSKNSQAIEYLVENLELNSSSLSITDKKQKQQFALDKLHLHVSGLNSDPKTWMQYELGLNINKTGSLDTKGKLQRSPLRQEGELAINRLGLKFLNPYINPYTYLLIDNGVLSIDAKEKYDSTANGSKMSMNGKVKLDSIALKDERINKILSSCNRVEFGYTFDYLPNRFYIDKLIIDSLYTNTVIDKDKTINYAKLMKSVQKESNTSVSSSTTAQKKEPFPIKIAETKITNATADFADHSLLYMFETHIHDLNGKIYSISNAPNEMSNVDLDGVVDKYGSAKIRGSINAADPKKYTDMRVSFGNLALNNLTAYSATFAGYKIDDGKLFVKLGYKIDDSKLDSTNNIVIKHIKLGDTVKEANVTILPLRFAVALLEDKEGIIDIDLPIQGDLKNPDFKYGTIIWKMLGNLVTKAATAPFKLLGSLLGFDSEKVQTINFEAGKSLLTPPEIEKLDKLAEVLQKRAKVSLAVTPTFDKNDDIEMMQRHKLMAIITQKSKDINDIEKRNALYVELLEKIYLQNAPKEKLDAIRSDFQKEHKDFRKFNQKYSMRLMKEDSVFINVTNTELQQLALARAQAIYNYLVKQQNVDSTRVVLQPFQEDNDVKDRIVKTKLDIVVK